MSWKIKLFLLTALLYSGIANTQTQGNFSKTSSINQVLNTAYAYSSVAAACGDKRQLDLKTRLVQLLNIASAKGDLLPEGKALARNLSTAIEAGASEFKRRPYVTCSEASQYYKPLTSQLDAIINANRQ